MTVGDRIRRYRKAAKLTQAELGEAIGAARITIQQYEAGSREPKLAQLQAVARALGVPLTALVDDNVRTGGSLTAGPHSGREGVPIGDAPATPHQSASLTASPEGKPGPLRPCGATSPEGEAGRDAGTEEEREVLIRDVTRLLRKTDIRNLRFLYGFLMNEK